MANRCGAGASHLARGENADSDPIETREWLDALASVLANAGHDRAQFLLQHVTEAAREHGIFDDATPYSAYRNTISVERQGAYPVI